MSAPDPISATDAAPLSFAQERIWYLERMTGGGTAYHMPVGLRFRGPLDTGALAWALDRLRLRHDVLRTAIRVVDGEPRQIVTDWKPRELVVEDLTDAPDAEVDARLQAEVRRPFDLGSGIPIRWLLVRLGPEHHVLLQTAHHAFLDGVSHGVMFHDLAALYQARREGRRVDLATPEITYREYARREREALSPERTEELLEFWRETLAGDPPMLELPADRPRPPVQRYRGRMVSTRVGEDLKAALARTGREEGATEFMTLLAAFEALLYRYGGQPDLVVGTVVGGRRETAIESVVGCFINTVVVRTDLSGDPSFRDVVRRVAGSAFDALAHQDAPFEHVVRAVRPTRSASYNPLFQVLFRAEGVGQELPPFGDVEVEPFDVERGGVYCDLDLAVQPGRLGRSGGGLRLVLTYDSDLFDRATAERILEHYRTLLRSVAAEPDRPVSRIPILPEQERRTLLAEWSGARSSEGKRDTIPELLGEVRARVSPSRTAVEDESGTSLSYGELHERARRVAAGLRRAGVRRGDVVGVCAERGAGMVVALLSVLEAGAAYLPLDLAYPDRRIAFMVGDSGAKVVLCAGAVDAAGRLPDSVNVVRLEDLEAAPSDGADGTSVGSPSPEDLAYLIYTSGSTGTPKGVRVPHRAVASFLRSMARKPGLTERDRLLAVTTISFDIAVLELFLPLAVGATSVIADRGSVGDGRRLLELARARDVTIVQATPATWRLLIDAGWAGDPPLRVLCGGEAMDPDLARALVERSSEVWNLYGPTEATVWCTRHRVGEAEEGPVPIGRPIENARAYVLDETMEPVPVGAVGELWIGGEGVALGYHERPELTAERFVTDPFSEEPDARLYRTGDRARWRADGVLVYQGRRDHQVKIRGFRIELGEVEAALAGLPEVRQGVVTARPDATGEQRLVAYVVGAPGAAFTASEVRRWLAEALPPYMVPSLVIEMGALPLTPNGKVDRNALPESGDDLPDADQAPADEPSTPLERELARIWAEVLGIEDVGAGDNFFDLGGHSLLCMRAIHRMEEATGHAFDPRTMVLQTLRQIAAEVERVT